MVGERKQTRRGWEAYSNTSPHSCVILIVLYLIEQKIILKMTADFINKMTSFNNVT
jgi:hypothetical protein